MKKILILLILLCHYSLFPDDIRLQDVDKSDWEATAVTKNGINSYLYFNFSPVNQSVEVLEKDLNLQLLSEDVFTYQLPLKENPGSLLIYKNDIEHPIYSIGYYNDNYIPEISQINENPKALISFETVKDNYTRLSMQGILNYDRVRLRTAPNLEARQIGSLMKGNVVDILNRSDYQMKINDMNSFWFKVKTESGLAGWTYGYFMELGKVIYSDANHANFIFLKNVSLDQGTNQRFYFYKNNQRINDSGWISNNQFFIFEDQGRLISTSNNYMDRATNSSLTFEDSLRIYIFDFSGQLINEIEIESMTFRVERIGDSSLFYQIVEHGLDSDLVWSNRCIIYNHNGRIIKETIFNDSVSEYEFEHMGRQYRIRF